MAVLVDSSVWIAASQPRAKETRKLQSMIRNNELIHLIRPIQVEVTQGARSEEEFEALWEGFLGFDFLEVETRHWGLSAWNYFRCRKRGLTLTTLDCLIATVGKEYDVPVWTLDKTLLKAARIIGFQRFDRI